MSCLGWIYWFKKKLRYRSFKLTHHYQHPEKVDSDAEEYICCGILCSRSNLTSILSFLHCLFSSFRQYLTSLEERLQQCRDENDRLLRENDTLRHQVEYLQREVRTYFLI